MQAQCSASSRKGHFLFILAYKFTELNLNFFHYSALILNTVVIFVCVSSFIQSLLDCKAAFFLLYNYCTFSMVSLPPFKTYFSLRIRLSAIADLVQYLILKFIVFQMLIIFYLKKKLKAWTSKMAQWVKGNAARSYGLSSIPRTHTREGKNQPSQHAVSCILPPHIF